MRQCVIVVDKDNVRHTVARVPHEVRRASRSKRRQNSLDRHVRGGHVERLQRDLRHALTEGLGVQQDIREQEKMFFRRNLEQMVENVVPDFFHGITNSEDTVCNGIHQCEDTTLALRLVHVSRGGRGKQRSKHQRWATSPAMK